MEIRLPFSSAAWGSEKFSITLKQEIESLDAETLGLNQYATGFYTTTNLKSVMVLGAKEDGDIVEVGIIIFFTVTEEAYVCPVGMETRSAHYQYEGIVSLNTVKTVASFQLSLVDGADVNH